MDEPSPNSMLLLFRFEIYTCILEVAGKTIIVSEHRLYYLRAFAIVYLYYCWTSGKDYSAAEFEQLTEQQRADMGLRTFILEDLLPPEISPQIENKWSFAISFCL
ncbi:MAG: hypothetical protein ACLRWH_09545 [Emergencia sp.]